MGGRENGGILVDAADAGGPGVGFEARPVEVGDTAESLPSTDRNDGLERHRIGQLGESDGVRPGRLQRAVWERLKVVEARETGENPTVMAVKCSGDLSYRLVITKEDFQVTPGKAP